MKTAPSSGSPGPHRCIAPGSLRSGMVRWLARIVIRNVECRTWWSKLCFVCARGMLTRVFPRVGWIDAFGLRWVLEPVEVVDRHLIVEGQWEPEVVAMLRRYVHSDSVFFDIGAHMGYDAIVAARIGGAGQVFAFEPNPKSHARLLHHIEINACSQVTAIQAFVHSGGPDTIQLFIPAAGLNNSGRSSATKQEGYQAETVPTIHLSKEISLGHIPCPDVVKIDVEGAELAVLESLGPDILKRVRAIIVEITATQAGSTSSVDAYLTGNGFHLVEKVGNRVVRINGASFFQYDALYARSLSP